MLTLLKGRKFYKETFWGFLAQGTAFVFFIALNILLARYLGAERFGTWSFLFSVLSIVLLLSYLGIDTSSKKYIAQYSDSAELKGVLRSSLTIRLVCSAVFALIFLLAHRQIAEILGRPDFAPLLLAATPLIFLGGVVEYLKHFSQGLHRIKYYFVINALEYGLKFTFVLAALIFVNELIFVVHSITLAFLFASVVGFYIWLSYYRKQTIDTAKTFGKEIIKYSIPLFFVSIGFIVATEVDTIMLGMIRNDTEVGVYAAAKQIIIKLPHIALAISVGVMPVFAKLNSDNKTELRQLMMRLLKLNTIIFGTVSILILSLGWWFVPLIFGPDYRASVVPLMIMVPYILVFSYSVFLSAFMDYQGRATKRAVNLFIALTLNIILNLILIPTYGPSGAAIATSVAYIPYLLLNWIEVRKVLDS